MASAQRHEKETKKGVQHPGGRFRGCGQGGDDPPGGQNVF